MSAPRPTKIKLNKRSRTLELRYNHAGNEISYSLSCEYLRVHSPSAEVRGHGNGPAILQFGKKEVSIIDISTVGNYALKFSFDDGHDSGIYSWDYLHDLAINQAQHWEIYLTRLKQENRSRESQFIQIKPI